MLCESKCEDVALKLAAAIHRCICSRSDFLRNNIRRVDGEEEPLYTLDVYIALLYKSNRIRDITKEVRNLLI